MILETWRRKLERLAPALDGLLLDWQRKAAWIQRKPWDCPSGFLVEQNWQR